MSGLLLSPSRSLRDPRFSGDCPALAKFCLFQSSKDKKFALSKGESVSVSVSELCTVATGTSLVLEVVAEDWVWDPEDWEVASGFRSLEGVTLVCVLDV